jgi:hypothetical protein
MLKRTIGLPAAALLAMAALAAPAHAEIQYPWCIQYPGGRNGIGATSCSFVTYDQCRASASGLGNMCVENPAYPVRAEPVKLRKRRHKHHY